MVTRLNFDMPAFTRTIWANQIARDVWNPRIQRISQAWQVIEREAVLAEIKAACLQVLSPEELISVSKWAVVHGLVCLPLEMGGVSSSYASRHVPLVKGEDFTYRVVIASLEKANAFEHYHKAKNDDKIGALLGFPPCCRDFFDWAWNSQNWVDVTLPQATKDFDSPLIKVTGPLECNLLLRWLGIRSVSHLPCSFDCKDSEIVGRELQVVGANCGYAEEMAWLKDILSWPMQWSSLHGVATITTPVFRLVVDTTPLASLVVIERDGPSYPEEGARGNDFPFKVFQRMTLNRPSEYRENGFRSLEAMDAGHDMILKSIESLIPEQNFPIHILDLGCGNGILLEKIAKRFTAVMPSGVELIPSRADAAKKRLSNFNGVVVENTIEYADVWNNLYTIVLISHNRFAELEAESAVHLMNTMLNHSTYVLIYSYDEIPWHVEGSPIAEILNERCIILDAHGSAKILTAKS